MNLLHSLHLYTYFLHDMCNLCPEYIFNGEPFDVESVLLITKATGGIFLR